MNGATTLLRPIDRALVGSTTRPQLDAAAATAAELGLELAPVELQYTTSFALGSMSLRVVDPTAVEGASHVKAEVSQEKVYCEMRGGVGGG